MTAQMTKSTLTRLTLAIALLFAAAAPGTAQSGAGFNAEIDIAMGAFEEQPFESDARWSAVDPEQPFGHQGAQPFDQEPPFAQFDFENFGAQGGVCDPQLQVCL